jgi:aminopeptidase-like protein
VYNNYDKEVGERIYQLAVELFPICRSLTGPGVHQTLNILKREVEELKVYEIPTGTKAFDWTVPQEWSINDAYIMDSEGNRVVDFKKSNLHVISYSIPVDTTMTLEELQPYLHSLPSQPDAIPYLTSYYERRWGFCLSENQRASLKSGMYRVKIDSKLEDGYLRYGEIVLKGKVEEEVFLSTYVCHPSMGNNELSGPTVTIELAKWINSLKERHYTYRIIFIPETIGSILYLSRNLEHLKKNVIAGFNITCCGDNNAYSFMPSRDGNTISDNIARHVLKYMAPDHNKYSFLNRGSDERQYCSPGVDLPVTSVMRSKYHTYPEYHTSKDDLSYISPEGLFGGYNVIKNCISCLEHNVIPNSIITCEPHLSSRGLYPTLSTKNQNQIMSKLMDVIAYSDGKRNFLEIAEIIGWPMWELFEIIDQLREKGIIETKYKN